MKMQSYLNLSFDMKRMSVLVFPAKDMGRQSGRRIFELSKRIATNIIDEEVTWLS